MRAAVLARLLVLGAVLAATRASAGDAARRFAVVAGASLGGDGRTPLRYATSDAREVSRVLRRLGGVARDDLVLVEDPDAERLRAALAGIAAEARRARAPGRRVELVVYYSGHSDEQGLLLGGSRLSYADLRSALDAVPADVRVAILDSCASGAFTRSKGGVHRPPFLLDGSSRVNGHAFLTSSAADEASQESDRLRASFFTHALLTGLRGAADASGDGVVTLNEAYQFAFRETLARTETTQAGPQHPTFDIALAGSGEVVMTDLHRADAVLVIPEAIDGQVFVRNAAGQLVVELRKVRGARIEVALEEGRYDVKVTRERRVLAGPVELPPTGQVVLEEARLAVVELEATVSRGEAGGVAAPGEATPGAAAAASAPPAPDGPAAWEAEPAPERPGPVLVEPYVLVRAGAAVPQNTLAGELQTNVELALGVWVHRIVAAELSVGYSDVSGTETGMLPGDGVARPSPDGAGTITVYYAPSAQVRDEVTTIPIFASLKLGLPAGPVRPYLVGGLGVTSVHVEREPAQRYAWLAPGAARQAESGAVFAVQAGIGVTLRLSPRAFAAVEGRYAWTKEATMFTALGAPEALRFDAFALQAGLGASF